MATEGQIRDFAARLSSEFRPDRVILFGSHATGHAQLDSDVDLLVIMPFDGLRARQAAAIRTSLQPSFSLDLLIRTPEEVRQRQALGDPFIGDILNHGQVLYESADSRVG